MIRGSLRRSRRSVRRRQAAGSESVNDRPVSPTTAFGLVTVNVRIDVAPTATGFGEKALTIVGGRRRAAPRERDSS